MASSPGTETLEGPGAGPFISACESEDNVTEGNGGPRASQHQAEALGKGMENEKTPTNRPSHPGRKGKDKSILRSRGTVEPLWESRRTRAAYGAKDMAPPPRNTISSVSPNRGVGDLKN